MGPWPSESRGRAAAALADQRSVASGSIRGQDAPGISATTSLEARRHDGAKARGIFSMWWVERPCLAKVVRSQSNRGGNTHHTAKTLCIRLEMQ